MSIDTSEMHRINFSQIWPSLPNQLYQERRPGQFLLERPAGDSILLAPYVEPGQVASLLNSSSTALVEVEREAAREVVMEVAKKPDEPALDARSARIRDMLKAGIAPKQIIKEEWGATSGNAYIKASQELNAIIASLL